MEEYGLRQIIVNQIGPDDHNVPGCSATKYLYQRLLVLKAK